MDDDFEGNYNGGGHAIKGLYMSANTAGCHHVGLFGSVEDGAIENLTIKDSYICVQDGAEYVGLIAGRGDYHTMRNCHVENSIIDIATTGCIVGGIIGTSQYNAQFTSCSANVHFIGRKFSNTTLGGIIGLATKNMGYVRTLTNCKTTGKINIVGTETDSQGANGNVGGIVGHVLKDDISFYSCVNKMNFIYDAHEGNHDAGVGNLRIGGILGFADPTNSLLVTGYVKMYKCANMGDFIIGPGPDSYTVIDDLKAAGLVYAIPDWGTLEDCVNYGNFKLKGRVKTVSAHFAGLVLIDFRNSGRLPCMRRCLNIQLANEIPFDLEKEDKEKYGTRTEPGICILDNLSFGFIFNTANGLTGENNGITDVYYYLNNKDDLDNNNIWSGSPNHSREEANATVFGNFKYTEGSEFRENKPFFDNGMWGVISDVGSDLDGLPLLYSCGGMVISLPGAGTSDDPYQISSEEELRALAKGINEDSKQITGMMYFKLVADINMSDEPFTPIGTADNSFDGTFNGNGHYINNMHLDNGALFGYANGTIKNLSMLNVVNKGLNGHSAAILDQGSAIIQNCYVSGTIECVGQEPDVPAYLAGIACNNTQAVQNSYFVGDLILQGVDDVSLFGPLYVGGITAFSAQPNKNCFVHTNLTFVGYIGEYIEAAENNLAEAEELIGGGPIEYYFGGIVGYEYYTASRSSADNSFWLCNEIIKYGIGNKEVYDALLPQKITDESQFRSLASTLGSPFQQGYYRPVLPGFTKTYAVTDPDGNSTYIDAIDTYDKNVILNYTADDNYNDNAIWLMHNLAIYTPSTGQESLNRCELDADTDLKLRLNDNATSHRGILKYTVKAENDGWHTLCLPCDVKKEDIPAGGILKICGAYQPTYGSMNVIECDSVPAGVPFIAYIPTELGDFNLIMHGNIVSEPQKADETSSLVGTFKNLVFNEKECNIASESKLSYDSENHTAKPFTAYAAIEGTGTSEYTSISLNDYILFSETDSYLKSLLVGYTGSTTANVKLYRKFYAGKWNTLCVPFAMTAEQLKATFGDDVVLEKLSSVTYSSSTDAYTINFEDVTASGVEAYKPYIIKPSVAGQLYDISSAVVLGLNGMTMDEYVALTENAVTDEGNTIEFTMIGSPMIKYIESGDDFNAYFLQDDKFYRVVSDRPILSYGLRCWFKASSLSGGPAEIAQATVIHDDSSTTGIRNVNAKGADNAKARIYDLQGRQVKTMNKGLYITNGKKLLKK
ncbi:MAG: hypothetical protein ACI4V5_06590 [Prevotella sp.]